MKSQKPAAAVSSAAVKLTPPSIGQLIKVRGRLSYPIGFGHSVVMYGGPFMEWDKTLTRGICLAPEQPNSKTADVLIAVKDFGIPHAPELLAALSEALTFAMRGEPIYIGCGAGIGRTGLFMACFLKLLGDENPINTVRARYYSHAVETKDQAQFIDDLKFPFALKCKAAALTLAGVVRPPAMNDRPKALLRRL